MNLSEYQVWINETASEEAILIETLKLHFRTGETLEYSQDSSQDIEETLKKLSITGICKIEFKGLDDHGDEWHCIDELQEKKFIRITNGKNYAGIPSGLKRREKE